MSKLSRALRNPRWKQVLNAVAPTLGTALGGPVGGLAAAAIAKGLLGKDTATQTEIANLVLSATPEQLTSLKQIENNFKAQMAQLEIDVFRLEIEDRKSARQMAIATSLWPQIILSALAVTVFGIVLYYLFANPTAVFDDWQKTTIAMLLGVLLGEVKQVYGYWIGTSKSSSDKNDVLAEQLREK